MTKITGVVVIGHSRLGTLVQVLHATKGWKPPHFERRSEYRGVGRGTFLRTVPRENPVESHPMARLMSDRIAPIPITAAAQMRHRERRRDLERAANLARLAQP